MLTRVLEPEVMDTAEEAADYDSMDHAAVNRCFVEDWGQFCQCQGLDPTAEQRMLDVGTGTALIPIEFARQFPRLSIVAIDLAEEMLQRGRMNVAAAGFADRIDLRFVDAKQSMSRSGEYQTVVSNSIIHHIPEPLQCLQRMVQSLAPGGVLLVRDLYRPDSLEDVEQLVQQYAAEATSRQQQLFRQSFQAALTVADVAELLKQVGIPASAVRMTSDRHWTIAWRQTT
ncbi:MAG: class I SAM-dependent methyltransferase [Planctomycetota bacterium]|nr:MAG: class I SAM-dependent methyltransferase [Planctomycetota bacterium]